MSRTVPMWGRGWSRTAALALISAVVLFTACAGDLNQPSTDDKGGTIALAPAGAGSLTPVASLTLSSGNVISFYEIGGRALVTEMGEAYTAPGIKGAADVQNRRLGDIWTSLAPDVPVPQSLKDLQARIDSEPAPLASNPLPQAPSAGGVLPEVQLPTTDGQVFASPVGCNNGCCDYDWMTSTFTACAVSGDYHWVLYNYGSTYANVNNITWYSGFVCAATGTSTFNLSVGGGGGVFSVPEAHYYTYYWTACIWPWCGGSLTSSVNTPTAQHLHTYCGVVTYD